MDIGCIQVFEGIGSILFMFYVLIVWCEKYIIIISLNFILKSSITKKGYIIEMLQSIFQIIFPIIQSTGTVMPLLNTNYILDCCGLWVQKKLD